MMHMEARWDSADKDDRANFFYSSSLADADENKNTLFLYNYVRGQLKNLPHISASAGEAGGTGSVYVHLYSGSANNAKPDTNSLIQISVSDQMSSSTAATGGWISTGVYTASVCLTAASTPLEKLFDVWSTGRVNDTQWHTGSIYPELLEASSYNPTPTHVTKVTNMKAAYFTHETARFRLFVREKGWNPSIYSKGLLLHQTSILTAAPIRFTGLLMNMRSSHMAQEVIWKRNSRLMFQVIILI